MKKRPWIVTLAGVIVLSGCFGGYKVYASHMEQKHFQEAQATINDLFKDKEHKILAANVKPSLIKKDQKKISLLKDKNDKNKLIKELEKASVLLDNETTAKKNVNECLKDGILADGVTESQLDEAQKLVLVLTDPTLKANLQKKLDAAKTQYTAQVNAVKSVFALFTDGTHSALADQVNRDSYNASKKLAEAVQNQAKKKELTDLLANVDTLLTQKEKTEADAEIKAKAAAAQTSTAPSTSSASTSKPTAQAQPTGFAGIVANSKTAQKTDQIVTVVGSGTTANVTLWEKSNNQWGEAFSTSGMVGSQGIGQATEGSEHTPKGAYTLGFAFGQSNPGTKLPFRHITPNSYWISDVNSNLYNTWQEGNFSGNGNEHLADYENLQYYYAIVINYNMNAVKGAGSGFFLHVSNGQPTAGCVAVPKSYMEQFMTRILSGAYIINVTSENEVANY
ncbi:L,D-transpeptidase family protein [Neobacillus sp. PS3-12]|uniref:L,D-transpeptidase family protein n=1 Tax=Neobacillus sp. PS3-12 TaxID=3070677 RepID=UPI0027E040A6|nr:L,D-transpeptidase family protein [Neobacillus sp. PS3-12]WML55135.1 L,D-transpeptidase family protein [Neobacillus sp. PS3-12]